MREEIAMFGDIEFEKKQIHQYKSSILIKF